MSPLQRLLIMINYANAQIKRDMSNDEFEAFFIGGRQELLGFIKLYTNYNDVQDKASEFWPEFYERSTKALKSAIKKQGGHPVYDMPIGRF